MLWLLPEKETAMDAIEFLQQEHQKAKRERCLYRPIARDGASDPRLARAGREMRQSKAEKAGRPG
jgi:hypothetical protein